MGQNQIHWEWAMKSINRKIRQEKRGETKGLLFVALLFFILFPYIISSFSKVEKQTLNIEETPGQIWVSEEKIWGSRKIPLEEYLIGMVAATIPVEYHMETIKTQAVILRSFCMAYVEKEDGKKIIRDKYIKEFYFSDSKCRQLWKEKTVENTEKIKQAILETKGVVVVSEGKILKLPFCRMSNGQTRGISEYVIDTKAYQYLKSVECEEDKMAPEYIQYRELTKKEFEKVIKNNLGYEKKNLDKITLYRDNADYVKEVKIGDEMIEGEHFREAFGLVSSCYFLEIINENIQIKTKGIGHGYGFSQYTANQLAGEEKDYIYLLNYFFSNITTEKI